MILFFSGSLQIFVDHVTARYVAYTLYSETPETRRVGGLCGALSGQVRLSARHLGEPASGARRVGEQLLRIAILVSSPAEAHKLTAW